MAKTYKILWATLLDNLYLVVSTFRDFRRRVLLSRLLPVVSGPPAVSLSTPKLGAPQWANIERALRAGPRVAGFRTDLWTVPRVAEVIERLTQVRYHPGHVWRLLRGLNGSLPRPARRARARDETT